MHVHKIFIKNEPSKVITDDVQGHLQHRHVVWTVNCRLQRSQMVCSRRIKGRALMDKIDRQTIEFQQEL